MGAAAAYGASTWVQGAAGAKRREQVAEAREAQAAADAASGIGDEVEVHEETAVDDRDADGRQAWGQAEKGPETSESTTEDEVAATEETGSRRVSTDPLVGGTLDLST
jgi:hypothetical protein